MPPPKITSSLKKQPWGFQLLFWGTKLIILALAIFFLIRLRRVLS
ncbi:MAG: hypothetical protein Q7S65_01585 [Nanoarchaeota archaeon]|nr:hypothetical protein [Nanoarchaeota archaeon]